jgi:hypothetical protein
VLAECDLDGLAPGWQDMIWTGLPSGSWMRSGQAGSRISGANRDGLSLYWLDTIWTGQAGWTYSGCDLDGLGLECLQTIEMGGRASSLLAGHSQDRLALGQLIMIWTD